MTDTFTLTTGTWGVAGDWSAGVPITGESGIVIGPTVTDLTIAGAGNIAYGVDAEGLLATTNTLDVTGTFGVGGQLNLTMNNFTLLDGSSTDTTAYVDLNSFSGMSGIELDVYGTLADATDIATIALSSITLESAGTMSLVGIAAMSGSVMDIYGHETITSSGFNITTSTINIESGGYLGVTNGLTTTSGDTLIVNGTLQMDSGGSDPIGASTNIINAGGTFESVNYEGPGITWDINGGTFIDNNQVASHFNFEGVAGGNLDLAGGPGENAGLTITNFAVGDTLEVGAVTLSSAVLNSSGVVTFTETDGTQFSLANFTLASGNPTGTGTISLLTANESNGQGALVSCFYPGTRLATAEGEIAVEDITAGTLLKTASGAVLPVRWLGRSEISTRFADKLRALPVRIMAGALGENLPVRDLLVSPCHAMFVGGVLVQAGALVNGSSIMREANVPEVFTYYHVELATHELLLAEGSATESFIDHVDRMHFSNWAEHEALGEAAPMVEMPYPRALANRQVPLAVRRMIEARATQFAAAA